MSTKKPKPPDPFAVEVSNNEVNAVIERMAAEGKIIHRMEVIEHGYRLIFFTPVRKSSSDLVDLILDYSADCC